MSSAVEKGSSAQQAREYLRRHDFLALSVQKHTLYGNTQERFYYVRYREVKYRSDRKETVIHTKEITEPYTRADLLLFDPESGEILDKYDAKHKDDSEDSEEQEWEVDKIVGEDWIDGQLMYHVLWKPEQPGMDAELSWEAPENVIHCTEVMKEYRQRKLQQKSREKKSRRRVPFVSSDSESDSDSSKKRRRKSSDSSIDCKMESEEDSPSSSSKKKKKKRDRRKRKSIEQSSSKNEKRRRRSKDDDHRRQRSVIDLMDSSSSSESSSDESTAILARKPQQTSKRVNLGDKQSSSASESRKKKKQSVTSKPSAKGSSEMRKQSEKKKSVGEATTMQRRKKKKRRTQAELLAIELRQRGLAGPTIRVSHSTDQRGGTLHRWLSPSARINRHQFPIPQSSLSMSESNTASSNSSSLASSPRNDTTVISRPRNSRVMREMYGLIGRRPPSASTGTGTGTERIPQRRSGNDTIQHRTVPQSQSGVPLFTPDNLIVTDSELNLGPFHFEGPAFHIVDYSRMPELENEDGVLQSQLEQPRKVGPYLVPSSVPLDPPIDPRSSYEQ